MLKDKRVMVTGGESMIGRAIVQELYKLGASVDPVPHRQCDLLYQEDVHDRFAMFRPDYVIHAAGWNGGMAWCKQHPATIYYRTATMALNVYTIAAKFNVKKVLGILASCSYPDNKIPHYQECNLWGGLPNPSIECHGLAKRIIADYGRQITKQYDTNCVYCILNNSYGPYDSYHPDKTKVVGAMIRRFVEAKQQNLPEVVCWGSGTPLRDFIYAEDAGRAIVKCLLTYNDPREGLNITTGTEISIKDLSLMIAELVGYKGNIFWDTTKPDGQMRKSLSSAKQREIFYMDWTPIKEGLAKTIEWYINNKEEADNKGF